MSWMSSGVVFSSCVVCVVLSYWMSWMSCWCRDQFLDVLSVSSSVLGCLGCLLFTWMSCDVLLVSCLIIGCLAGVVFSS